MTTDEIDRKFVEFLISKDACPNTGFMGFPKALCASVNSGKLNYIHTTF